MGIDGTVSKIRVLNGRLTHVHVVGLGTDMYEYQQPVDGDFYSIPDELIGRVTEYCETIGSRDDNTEVKDADSILCDFLSILGVMHDSDCALHNEHAYPKGDCDCSVRPLLAIIGDQ